MPDDCRCPVGCGHLKRPPDLMCRRCWYVLDDNHKQAWREALANLRGAKTGRNIQALLVVKMAAIRSLQPSVADDGP